MAITFRPLSDVRDELAEFSPEAEQNYLDQFRRESAEYIKVAEQVTSIEDGFIWADMDEFVVSEAKAANARKGKIIATIKNPLSPMMKVAQVHKPLTDELTQERKEAMLEAASIIRDALDNFTGEVREAYEEAAGRIERDAEALETYTEKFNPTRYGLGSHYVSIDPVVPGGWSRRG